MKNKLVLALLLAVSLSYASVAALTISQPTVYDCKGSTMGAIRIINTHDVTVKNCNIVVTSENGIQITDSYNILIDNVDVSSTYPEGTGINLDDTAAGLNHDITVQDFHIHGPMGWGFAGSPNVIKKITIRNGLIEDIGQAGGQQKHGMYVNNWQDFLIENVTILRSWNIGIKIVSETTDGTIRRVTIKDSGRSGASGPGVSFGDSRISHIKRIMFENCIISNSVNPALWLNDFVNGVHDITVDHCTFVNNYFSIHLPTGTTGWKVTNNIGLQDTSWDSDPSHVPLLIEGGDADIPKNYFDNNDWYFKAGSGSNNPIRVVSTTMALAQWQAKTSNPDPHSISADPKFISGSFKPLPDSPVCGKGSNGGDIGAIPCFGSVPNACITSDWSYSDGACQPSNTLTRTWTKTGFCQGGVSYPATQSISCTYTLPACTASDWSYTDGVCQSSNTLIRTWTKTGNCQGGVSHPGTETVTCIYAQKCSDGTLNNSCSTNKPKYCNGQRILVDKCSQCGCPSGLSCATDESCKSIASGLSFEAESGVISAPFVSGNGYVYQTASTTAPSLGGKASYLFSIAQAGDYMITVSVNSATDASNSVYLNIDSEPADPPMIWDIPLTNGVENRTASWRGGGTFDNNEFVPKVFALTQGQHELIIRGREANVLLDKIAIRRYAPVLGDVNGDDVVNMDDIRRIILDYGKSVSSDPRADVNNDGMINILDAAIIAQNFGRTA